MFKIKLSLLEDAIISGKYSFKEDTSDNNTSRFAINILKDRISSLEDEIKSKDAIIAFNSTATYYRLN